MFKRSMLNRSAIALALTLVAATGASAADWACTTVAVNFRSGPSTQYEALGTIKPWTKVSVDDCSSEYGPTWCNVSWSSHYGWVAKKYLSYDDGYCANHYGDTAYEAPKHKKPSYSAPAGY